MIRRTTAQIAIMANPAHRKHGGRRARAIEAPSKLDGVRPDLRWCRRGQEAAGQLERSNHELVDALEWQHVRRGQELSDRDLEVLDALAVRAWGWEEVQTRRLWSLPTWADELVPARRASGYARFLALLLAAYRAGALGVVLGYHECMALAKTRSTDTWRRWCVDMEERGLVRIIQTWRSEPDQGDGSGSGRPRCHAKLFYRLGPAWEEAGPGLCEGAYSEDGPAEAWMRRMAAHQRRKAMEARDDRCASLWDRTPHKVRYMRKPATSGFPISGEQSPPDKAGGLDPGAPAGAPKVLRSSPASPSRAAVATPPATDEAPTTGDRQVEFGETPSTEPNRQTKSGDRRARKPRAPRSPGGQGAKPAKAVERLVSSRDHDGQEPDQPHDPGEIKCPAEAVERVRPERVKAIVADLLRRMDERGLPISQGPPGGRAPPGPDSRGERGGGRNDGGC